MIWSILKCSFFTQYVKKSICYKCPFKIKYTKIEYFKVRVQCRSYSRNWFLKLLLLFIINKSMHVLCSHIKCMSSMQHWLFLSFAWNAPLPSCDLSSNTDPGRTSWTFLQPCLSLWPCLLPLRFCRCQDSCFWSFLLLLSPMRVHKFFKLREDYRPLERPVFISANKEVVEKDLNKFQLSVFPATLNSLQVSCMISRYSQLLWIPSMVFQPWPAHVMFLLEFTSHHILLFDSLFLIF